MKTRISNALILSMKPGQAPFKGEVRIENDRITKVLTQEAALADPVDPETVWDIEIDAEGRLLMPGFKDAHTHSGMTFLRSRADDLPLQEWLTRQVFPYEARLTPEDIYTLTKLAILEYVRGGVTGIMEMYLTPESIAQACIESGMRVLQVGSMNDFSQSIPQQIRWYEDLNGKDPLSRYAFGFHAEYTCSESLLKETADVARSYGSKVYAHCAETANEVKECRERHGASPVEYLTSLGLFDRGGAMYHLVHTDVRDLEILRDMQIAAVLNPASNAKLASGIAPVSDYLTAGLTVGLGTDGPASNNALDMFREMYLAAVLTKLRDDDAAAVDALRILEMATVGSARAMDLEDGCYVDEGQLADLILIDLSHPNMHPLHNIAKNLVYAGGVSDVVLTMIGGKVVYDSRSGEDRYFIGAEPEMIYRDTEAICRRILD